MNKKPAVAAKTARKTKLSRSQVEMAKHFNVSLEDMAKKVAKKRGRPAGVKNKPKPFKEVVVSVNDPVDWEKLAKQLQAALASQIKDNDVLERELGRTRTFFERLVCLVIGRV